MSKDSLQDTIDVIAERAAKLFDQHGEVTPVYVVRAGNGQEVVFERPPGDKDTAVTIVRAVLRMYRATRVVTVTEAWMLDRPTTPVDLDKIAREGVEAQPERIEVVLIMGEDAAEGAIMARMQIIRDGGHARLGPLKCSRHDASEGRMVGLLPHEGTAH